MDNEIKAEDILETTYVGEYRKQLEALWIQLVSINANLFYIEKLESFRFDIFLNVDDGYYWQITKNALLEACISGIYRVGLDTGEDFLSLLKFRSNVFKHLRKDVGIELRKKIGSVKFEGELKEVERKIRDIRHHFYGHLQYDTHVNPDTMPPMLVNLAEIKHVFAELVRLFHQLGFAEFWSLWYPCHSENRRKNNDTDIDHLLDSVAKNSQLLNSPENNPDLFRLIREDMKAEEIQVLNAYRRKFGLPEI
jgi:hypothetical protein